MLKKYFLSVLKTSSYFAIQDETDFFPLEFFAEYEVKNDLLEMEK